MTALGKKNPFTRGKNGKGRTGISGNVYSKVIHCLLFNHTGEVPVFR